jgi:hypothetical protein
VHGYTVIIEHKLDIVASKKKIKVGPWQGVVCGVDRAWNAMTRDELIETMREHLQRRKALDDLRAYCRKKQIERMVQDLVDQDRERLKRPGG